MIEIEACRGCGFDAPAEDGETHSYLIASATCWRHFNAIMTREYSTPDLMPTHYLAVDAYAAQHPGEAADRRARQSIWIHLAGLRAVLRDNREPQYRYSLLKNLADAHEDWPLAPPHAPFSLVAGKIAPDLSVEEHVIIMRNWAESALAAYEAANTDLGSTLRALG